MDILKEIADERLVIMVTHNPELAEKYSTRIVRMLDGLVQEDSKPLTDEETAEEEEHDKSVQNEGKKKLPSMSMGTSFGLSLKNLFTKKGRTMLTSFAGSIGIIGIALIYALSQGFQNYINTVQEETLSSYPLTIEQTNTDLSAIMETFMNMENGNTEHDKDAVYKRSAVYEIVNAFNDTEGNENDLKSFKAYIDSQTENPDSKLSTALNGIQYTYDYDMLVYTKNVDGEIILSDAQKLMQNLIAESMNIDMSMMSDVSSSPMMGGGMMSGGMSGKLWQEMLSGDDGKLISPLIEKQYDVVYGSWPKNYDEIVLVLDANNELNDMALYALGLEPKEEIDKIMDAAVNGTVIDDFEQSRWSYEDICSSEYRVVLNSDCYSYDEKTGLYSDLRDTDTGMQYLYGNALPLKITGIIRPDEDATAPMLTGAIGYTKELTNYIIEHSKDSEVINAQLADEEKDVISGLPFKSNQNSMTDGEKEEELRKYIDSLDNNEKMAVYMQIVSTPSASELEKMTQDSLKGVSRSDMEKILVQMMTQQMSMSEDDIKQYIEKMNDADIENVYVTAVQEQIKAQYAQQAMQNMASAKPQEMIKGLEKTMKSMSTSDCAYYYDQIMQFSDSTYEDNLRKMGYIDIAEPYSINLYASTFENKDVIEDAISEYNEGKDELGQIKYTDYVGLMMSSITTIINAVTYALIAFVSISLIVSSIMIGVITLISVQERTKEIGILRAIGASKKNVSSMFNAETMLIGFSSGLMGVIVSWLLTFPINALIKHLTDISNLKAVLPLPASMILIAISVMLTLISGIIPSRSASKKDPVVALRTE